MEDRSYLFRDFGHWDRSIPLFEAYLQASAVADQRLEEAGIDSFQEAAASDDEQLQEAAVTSDFATYLNDKATKRVMWGYNEVPSAWRTYARTYDVPDFKPISFVRLSEMQDLLPVSEHGEYQESELAEIVGPSLTVGTFGRLFGLSRKAIINDDLNQLRDRPAAMGRAAARTLAKDAVAPIVSNPNAYDGTALFHATHGNLDTTALSEDALRVALSAIRTQTDPNGNRIVLRGQFLVIPPELEVTARRILQSTVIPQPVEATATAQDTLVVGRGGTNPLQNIVDYVVEDYLLDANDWFLFADPNQAPVTGVGFLNNVQQPDVFLNDPGMVNVLGGRDPYQMRIDVVHWKCRHDWGTGVFDWRGAQKRTVT
jgi:hypothetical protein